MTLKLEDGIIWYASELLAGNGQDYKGALLNFAMSGKQPIDDDNNGWQVSKRKIDFQSEGLRVVGINQLYI